MNNQGFAGPGCHTERSSRLREQLEGPAQDHPVSYAIIRFMAQNIVDSGIWNTRTPTMLQSSQFARAVVDLCDELERLRAIVADDALAIEFQSIGQYRSMLFKQIPRGAS